MTDPDPLVEELVRARRDRRVLVVCVAIGIVLSVVLGLGASLGALVGTRTYAPATLALFVGPLALSTGLGYALYRRRVRRR